MSKNECVSEGLFQNQVGDLALKKRKLKIYIKQCKWQYMRV